MKKDAVHGQTSLLNLIVLSAVLLYALIPVLGLETWHRVIPEHDHLLLSSSHDNSSTDLNAPDTLPVPITCTTCSSAQTEITVLHLPNPLGASSVFTIGACDANLLILVHPFVLIENVPDYAFHTPQLFFVPLDPPPTSNS